MRKASFIKSLSTKSIVRASILALALVCFQTLTFAQAGGSSVQGNIRFSLEDGLTKSLEFSAVANTDGSTTGHMAFSGPAEFPEQEVSGTGHEGFSGRIENLSIEAEFDGLIVERNRAVMSGTVTGSTIGDYIGQRILLVVEDNGTGIARDGDKFSWGLYKPADQSWIPADAELREDDGWRMTWTATDAERRDDPGLQIRREWSLNCQTFPLSSYDFVEVTDGEGDIQVRY